jgi:biopolymer transport protein ExbD
MNTNQALLHSEEEPALMMEINTTPLIDVMLVLLIMLIITIPLQLHAIDLEIPARAAASVQTDSAIIQIRVAADGTLRWNDERLADAASLDLHLQDIATEQGPEPDIHIEAHATARYEVVASVLANAQRRGLKKLNIVGTEAFANP